MARKRGKQKNELTEFKMIPIPQWDKETFYSIVSDRGFRNDIALIYYVSKELGCSRGRIREILNTGRMSWGEVLCLGAVFEMTPKEFCDCFLHDYFRAYAEGVYRAAVDDYGLLMRVPTPVARNRREDDDGWRFVDEDKPPRGVRLLVTTSDGDIRIGKWDFRRGYPPTRMYWQEDAKRGFDVKAWKPLEAPCKRKEKKKENDD